MVLVPAAAGAICGAIFGALMVWVEEREAARRGASGPSGPFGRAVYSLMFFAFSFSFIAAPVMVGCICLTWAIVTWSAIKWGRISIGP